MPRKNPANGQREAWQFGSSYAGINRIKFAGLIDHLSAFKAHPGQGKVYAIDRTDKKFQMTSIKFQK
jgi:hypothetical protein